MSEPTSTTPAYPPRDLTSPQLTVRAVATGMVLGGLLSLCNIYVSLQIGWSTNMSVTGVLLAWALWKAIDTVTDSTKPFGILENNINQTTCSAAAAVSSAGLVAPIPALALLTGTELSYPQLAFWVFSVCLVGIVAAVAIRRQMIIVDQLPFPGGLATAHTLKEVYGTGADAMKRVAMLGVGALAAGLVKLVALTKVIGHLAFPGKLAGHKLGDLGFELDQSLLMVGVGGLVGTRGAWSMLVGAVLAWGVVAPWALNQGYVELKTNETLTALPEGVTLSPSGRLHYLPARKQLELRGPLSETERDDFLAMSEDPAWRAAVTKLAIESERTYMSAESAERFDRIKESGDWTTVVRVPEAARAALSSGALLSGGIDGRIRVEDGHVHLRGLVTGEDAKSLAAILVHPTAEAGAASELKAFLGQLPAFSDLRTAKANFTDVLAWLLWPGVTLMVVSSLVSFSFSWRSIARAFRGGGAGGESDSGDMPFRWYTKLAIGAAALSIIAQVVLFDIAWWAAALGVVLSVVLAVVAARVSGETNNTPIGAMGKVTQLTFGAVLPADPAANLMTANVTGGAASQAADLMHDMKTGALIGATPWKQAIAQIFGAIAGALCGSAIYLILIPDPHTQLLTPKWPAPAVATWKAVAELFQRGFSALPEGIPEAMIIAGIAGVILPCLDRFGPARLKPWIPSSASLGLSFVVEAKNAISIFIGGMIALCLGRVVPNWTARFLVTLASGLIVGDALVGAGSAVATVLSGLWAT